MYNTFSKLQIEHTKEILREMVKALSPSQRKRVIYVERRDREGLTKIKREKRREMYVQREKRISEKHRKRDKVEGAERERDREREEERERGTERER